MQSRQFLWFCCILFSVTSRAEAQMPAGLLCQLGPGSGNYPTGIRPADPAIARMGARIKMDVCGPPERCGTIEAFEGDGFMNALTFRVRPGFSRIIYDRQFFQGMQAQYGVEAVYGILAHEIGHHLEGMNPALWMTSSWSDELRADAWAGCALARSGLSTDPLASALRAMSVYPSPSHPGWNHRLPAVLAGFQHCGGSALPSVGGAPRTIGRPPAAGGTAVRCGDQFCEALRQVLGAAPDDFSAIRGTEIDTETWRATVTLPGAAECRVSSIDGAWLYVCENEFRGVWDEETAEIRHDQTERAARARYGQIIRQLTSSLGPQWRSRDLPLRRLVARADYIDPQGVTLNVTLRRYATGNWDVLLLVHPPRIEEDD